MTKTIIGELITKMKDQISVRQTACFCTISLLALKLIALPSILFDKSNSSGLIVAISLIAFDFLMLFLYLKIKEKFPNQSLYELILNYFGKFIAKFVYIFITLFFILKICMLINEGVMYMQDVVDENCSLIVFLITYLPVLTALSFSGLRNTARTCEFGFVFILIGLIICLFLSEISLTFGEIGPIFVRSFKNIFNSCFELNFWFSDFLFVIVLADKIKIEKNFKRRIMSFVFFVTIILVILYLVYFRLFRVTAFLHKTAIEDIMQYNRNIGNVGNVDIIAILVYLFILYFQGALYMNCLNTCYEKIFEYKNNYHSLLAVNLLIIFVQYFIFYNFEKIYNFILIYFKYFGIFLWIIIPVFYIFLLIFSKGEKYGKKRKKNIVKN